MKKIFITLMALCFSFPSWAETIAICEESKGTAYYLEGGLVKQNKAGWEDDGFPGGSTILTRDGDDFDIIFRDATGSTTSTKESGGDVVLLGVDDNSYMLAVIYLGKTLEHYIFKKNGNTGEVVWGQIKLNAFISKGGLFTAKCKFG